MASTYGTAFEAAQAKALEQGYRIKRSKIYPVIDVVVIATGELFYKANLTKVEQFLSRKAGEAAVASYNAAQRAKVAAAIEAAK